MTRRANCSTIADRVVAMAARRRAGRGRRGARHATPRSGSTRARSSRSRRPSPQGIGIRVDRRRPPGLRLRRHPRRRRARRDARRGARQRRLRHARRVRSAWPSPTASPWPSSTCGATALAGVRHRRARSTWPSSSSGPCSAADPRISGVESAEYADAMAEAAVVTTTGIRTVGRETGCYVVDLRPGRRGRRDPDRLRLLGRARSPASSTSAAAAAEAAERATRLLGAVKPPSERLTVVLDPYVTAQFLGILGYTLNGEAVLKGRSLFADRLGEEVAVAARHPGRRPDQPAGLHRHRHRRRGPGHPPQRAHRRRRAAAVRAQRLQRPPGRHGLAPATPCAAASSARPASAAWPSRSRPAPPTQAELVAGVDDGVLVQDGAGPALGREPGQRRLLDRRRGPAHPRRRARRAGARVHHRLDAAADAARRAARSAATSSGCR